MSDLPVGALGFVVVLILGALVAYLFVRARKPRQRAWVPEEQGRQWRHQRLLSSLGALDLAMTDLTTAALRGSEQLAQELESGLARAISAADRSGDDELRRLVDEVAAHCDTLSATGQGELEDGFREEDLDRLVKSLALWSDSHLAGQLLKHLPGAVSREIINYNKLFFNLPNVGHLDLPDDLGQRGRFVVDRHDD